MTTPNTFRQVLAWHVLNTKSLSTWIPSHYREKSATFWIRLLPLYEKWAWNMMIIILCSLMVSGKKDVPFWKLGEKQIRNVPNELILCSLSWALGALVIDFVQVRAEHAQGFVNGSHCAYPMTSRPIDWILFIFLAVLTGSLGRCPLTSKRVIIFL